MPAKGSKKSQGRVRDVRRWWERNLNGPIIPRTLNPPGFRTPEGYVWGHKVEDFFWIQRIPGVNAVTIWSRSMLKEFGEGYDEVEWDEPLVPPRVRRPWPVLKMAEGYSASVVTPILKLLEDHSVSVEARLLKTLERHSLPLDSVPQELAAYAPLGAIDGGCEHEHADEVSYRIREDDPSERPANDRPDPSDSAPKVPMNTNKEAANPSPTADADVEMADAGTEGVNAAVGSADASEPLAAEPLDEKPTDDSCTSNEDDASDVSETEETQHEQQAASPVLGPEFSAEGLPKLEEFIPEVYFPDELMVHDPNNATHQPGFKTRNEGEELKPIKYIRLWPKFRRDMEGCEREMETRVGHLYLSKANRFGTGNHSYVYRAPLSLPSPLSAHSPDGRVTVAAKLAYARCSAHNLLRNEGKVYNAFPKYIQQEYCGYNIVPQCRFPVPATAIVPKFYGYYVPIDERGDICDNHHDRCRESEPCNVDWPSPILLMEECGNPVEPSKFTVDQRTECFSLIQRLHYMQLTQGSFYVRNIMIQPGPLTLPPAERSYDTPSFRIIDFGRGDSWETFREKVSSQRYIYKEPWDDWSMVLGDEIKRARSELLIDDFGF